jgi:predicted amidohydrolase YtcJ
LAEGTVEAIALWAGRVLAIGSAREIDALRGPRTRTIDLEGRLATPGLCDAHMHLLPLGITMLEVDVRPQATRTLDGLLTRIRERAETLAPGQWLLARGYDQFALDVKRHPTRDELDGAAPRNPVYLVRACGHIAVCNSLALNRAGLDETSPVPRGGAIEQRDGRLTGLLAETARDPVKAVIPPPSDEDLVSAIERAGRHCASLGITSVMDAAVGMKAGYREIAAYRTAQRTGRLPVRTHLCLLGGRNGIVEKAHADGLVTGTGDGMLMVGPVKIFTDGSAGGRTAAMTLPYLGEPKTYGLLTLPDEEMTALTRDYHAKGYQLAVHAIGDMAIEQTITAMETALAERPDPDRRHRIEHCGYARADQNERMRRLRIEPVPQPVFLYEYGDLYVSVVGEERAAASYPIRTWIGMGLHPAASTDAPVCDANPIPNLFAMTTRRTTRGTLLGPDQILTMPEALAAYTNYGAYVNKAERHRGRLLPGMAADVAVFSRDILDGPAEAILDTRCDLTILNGRIVHEAPAH